MPSGSWIKFKKKQVASIVSSLDLIRRIYRFQYNTSVFTEETCLYAVIHQLRFLPGPTRHFSLYPTETEHVAVMFIVS